MRLIHTRDIFEQIRTFSCGKCEELYTLYSVQPREYFLHGQFEAAHERLDRIRTVLETEEAAKPLEEAAFQKRLTPGAPGSLRRMCPCWSARRPGARPRSMPYGTKISICSTFSTRESDFPLQRFEKKMLSLIVLMHAANLWASK